MGAYHTDPNRNEFSDLCLKFKVTVTENVKDITRNENIAKHSNVDIFFYILIYIIPRCDE